MENETVCIRKKSPSSKMGIYWERKEGKIMRVDVQMYLKKLTDLVDISSTACYH